MCEPKGRSMTNASDYVFLNTPATRADRIARIDALATLLDSAVVIPGTNVRMGLDALIGLVPGIGDTVTTLLSLFIVKEARALGAPRHLILRMLGPQDKRHGRETFAKSRTRSSKHDANKYIQSKRAGVGN